VKHFPRCGVDFSTANVMDHFSGASHWGFPWQPPTKRVFYWLMLKPPPHTPISKLGGTTTIKMADRVVSHSSKSMLLQSKYI